MRKTKLTQDKIKRFCQQIEIGNNTETAAALSGFSYRSVFRWKAKGEEEIDRREEGLRPRKTWQIFVDFVEAFELATAKAEARSVARLTRIINNKLEDQDVDPRTQLDAIKFQLTHRFRRSWSKNEPQKIELETKGVELVFNVPRPEPKED
jgi:hypothetical protein